VLTGSALAKVKNVAKLKLLTRAELGTAGAEGIVSEGAAASRVGETAQAGKEAAEEAARQAGKDAAQHAAKELAEETGEKAAKATTPLAGENRVNRRVHARAGGLVLDDSLNASAYGARNRVVLDDRIVAPGQWKDGNILLSRSAIREVAEETGDSVRRVLYDTAYHERFHGAVEPMAKRVSKWLGVDDIYEASHDALVDGTGRGWWYRAEEAGAEFNGRLRGFLRHRWGWR
jgi:hypothetical protein